MQISVLRRIRTGGNGGNGNGASKRRLVMLIELPDIYINYTITKCRIYFNFVV